MRLFVNKLLIIKGAVISPLFLIEQIDKLPFIVLGSAISLNVCGYLI